MRLPRSIRRRRLARACMTDASDPQAHRAHHARQPRPERSDQIVSVNRPAQRPRVRPARGRHYVYVSEMGINGTYQVESITHRSDDDRQWRVTLILSPDRTSSRVRTSS